MNISERRTEVGLDRRRIARGGRRDGDRPGRFPHLLIADSYDGVRIPCVRYLHKFGFEVAEAADGLDALAKIAAAPPHVILMESALPHAPLSQLVRRLRSRPDTRSIPIIVMTSDVEWGADGGSEEPLVSVLVKPFGLAAMLQAVRRLLAERPPVVALAATPEIASI